MYTPVETNILSQSNCGKISSAKQFNWRMVTIKHQVQHTHKDTRVNRESAKLNTKLIKLCTSVPIQYAHLLALFTNKQTNACTTHLTYALLSFLLVLKGRVKRKLTIKTEATQSGHIGHSEFIRRDV